MAIYIPIVTELKSAGIDKAKKEFASLQGVGAKTGFLLKKAFLPATATIGALAAGLAEATKGAIEDAAAQDLLANNLRRTTGATDAIIKSTEDWISVQGQLLGISDDQLRPALAQLARATGSVTKSQKLVAQAMDISAATGKPLETVLNAVEKAYGGNMTALQRLAPEYRNIIKDGASFEEVMSNLERTTGGAASQAAQTAAGQFQRLSLAFSETKESIGAALLPVIEAALPVLQKFGTWAQNNPGAFLAIAGAIGAIAAAVVAVNVAMALNPFSLIAGGIAALIAGVVVAYNRFEGFRNIVDTVFNGLKWYVGMAKEQFLSLVGVFKAVFNGLASAFNNTIGRFSFTIPDIIGVPGRGTKFDMPNIPMLADGGIITGGATLAVVGEAGPEAVIPLDRLGSMGLGGGNNVTINVQGADPQAVVDALRTYMFRNGAVPIRVA